MAFHAVAIGAHHVERASRDRQAERDRKPLRRIGGSGEKPHAGREAGHVFEQQGRRLGPLVVDDLGKRPHLQLPVGALYPHQFARALDPRQEFAQVRVWAVIGVETADFAWCEHGQILLVLLPIHLNLRCPQLGTSSEDGRLRPRAPTGKLRVDAA